MHACKRAASENRDDPILGPGRVHDGANDLAPLERRNEGLVTRGRAHDPGQHAQQPLEVGVVHRWRHATRRMAYFFRYNMEWLLVRTHRYFRAGSIERALVTSRFASGSRPCQKEVRHAIGTDAALVQTTWPVGKPLVDGFGGGLYEVRTSLDGNIYRVHGFQKKTQKTPKADLDLARRRMREEKKS